MRNFAFIAGAMAVTGCIGTQYSQTGPTVPAREANCTFQVLAMPPSGKYAELGIIDFTGNKSQTPDTVPDLIELIRTDVCRAGGDAVVAPSDTHGYYRKAVVILREPSQAPAR